ncbi:MAG: 3-hydroxyisobutyrate dehydrogenase-like beta-hydroxyacid dehydrogenase [Myxococcota bacterium]|jgi:3-hydroxyisobutyrate dehydrogenase-like beta-hydroxyacid dehydrogenase
MGKTGFLHPGEMGATIAATYNGTRLWVSDGRSPSSHQRAEAAGMIDVGTLGRLVKEADTIVSVCPPDSALEVAREVAEAGFDGLYVDANAIAPTTCERIGELFDRFVDGCIIGLPPHQPGTTRMYLVGDEADSIASHWNDSNLNVVTFEGGVGAASALKMCYAGWSKHNHALMLAIRAAAEAHGVTDELKAEWAMSRPDNERIALDAAARSSPKAWRFVGEMREIAATFEAVGLPAGFHSGAAELFGRMDEFKDAEASPDIDDVIAAILAAKP